MTEATAVSHGRGGTGNIGPDDTKYVDGGIHREGDPTAHGVPYSTGRGGASNIIASPKSEAVNTGNDDDIVPDVTKIITKEGPYHGGRGGEGNVVEPTPTKKKAHKGLADRIKEKLAALLKKNKTAKSPAATTGESKEEAKKEEAAPEVPTSETTVVAPAAEVNAAKAAEAEAAKPEEVKA